MNPPRLSVIVIVYDMRRQAMNTLRSLMLPYQEGVRAEDYEVIVVENRSARVLDAAEIAGLPANFRYFLRDEPGKSPAAAINFAIARARGPMVGIMIDGARLVTPGVLRFALMAASITPQALVAVPGYQIGDSPHHLTTTQTEATDIAMLGSILWPQHGYRLFEIASMSLANRAGFFRPFMECNCLFAPAEVLQDIGGADERFDLPGGGALNLYLYDQLVNHPRTSFFVLPGEGSFHQMHGGVTTMPHEDIRQTLEGVLEQLNRLMGRPFAAPDRVPVLLGTLNPAIHPFLKHSTDRYVKVHKPGGAGGVAQKG